MQVGMGLLTVLCGVAVLLLNIGLAFTNTLSLTGSSAVYAGTSASYTFSALISVGSIVNFTWTLNGTTLDQFSDVNIVTGELALVRTLQIHNVPVSYDNTEVHCTVVTSEPITNMSCGTAIVLRVQGLLGQVNEKSTQYDANSAALSITWSPPSAIAVPPAPEPEIFYCVEVMDGGSVISRGCDGSMNEETSYLLNNITCGVNYTVTITPSNRLGNGTSSSLQFPDAPQIMRSLQCARSDGSSLTYMYPVTGLVCDCSGAIVDKDVSGTIVCEPNMPAGFLNVTVDATTNENFTIDITARNSREISSEMLPISTFDVCDLNFTTAGSELKYSILFVGNSDALGVLIIILSISSNGQVNFTQSIYFVQGKTAAESDNQLSGFTNGNYDVLAYDVEASGAVVSDEEADRENVNFSGESNATSTPSLVSFGDDITCNSSDDEFAVAVTCTINATIFTGFTVYLQNDRSDLTLRSSTRSESSVLINGSVNGLHYVFVYPIWKPENFPSDNARMRPAYSKIHELEGIAVSTTTDAVSYSELPSVPQDISTSFSDSTETSSTRRPMTGGLGNDMAAIVGGVVAAITVVILIIIVLIVLTLYCMLKKRKHKTWSSGELKDTSYIMEDKEKRSQSPSNQELITPLYETARLPPPKVVSDSVKVNGDSSVPPPNDPAPDAPGPNNVADLYSVVDKSRPPEYESVQLIMGTKKKVEDIHKVEYASLQHQDPQPPKENSEEPPPLPARPEGTEEPTHTYVRPVDCYEVLSGMAAEWKLLAEYLGMDEDDIDEVFTNNESDVACLNDFLSRICILSTKEDMSEALEKMGLMHESKAILTLPNRKLMEGQY